MPRITDFLVCLLILDSYFSSRLRYWGQQVARPGMLYKMRIPQASSIVVSLDILPPRLSLLRMVLLFRILSAIQHHRLTNNTGHHMIDNFIYAISPTAAADIAPMKHAHFIFFMRGHASVIFSRDGRSIMAPRYRHDARATLPLRD